MVPTHRRIVMVGRALAPREQGPLIYSGFDMKHPDAARVPTTNYLFAFWYWVPAHQRQTYRGKSKVLDITALEAAMIATGELEEVRRNYAFPSTMSLSDLGRELLRRVWEPECIRRLGQIPEVFRGANPLSTAPAARALEQERGRVIVGE